MWRPLKRYLHRQYVLDQRKGHELTYLFWESTLRCNINCLHCGSDCHKDVAQPDMPKEDFFAVLDAINLRPHLPTLVVITGGEPLLRRDLEECGYAIRKRGFNWGIVSNGYAYTPQRHNGLMNAGMGTITISLDGLEDTHNWLRNNKQSFSRALSALELIAAERGLTYDVVTCVNCRNIYQLPQLLGLLVSRGIKAWRLFTIAPIGRAKGADEMALDAAQMKYLMDFIVQCRKRSDIDVTFSCEAYVGRYEDRVRPNFFFCRAGVNIASVLANGDICACPNIDRGFVQGNIYRDSFTDVWQNGFLPFRNREWMRTGVCASCRDFKHCNGGGFHYWDASKQGIMVCHKGLINDAD